MIKRKQIENMLWYKLNSIAFDDTAKRHGVTLHIRARYELSDKLQGVLWDYLGDFIYDCINMRYYD